MGKIPCCSWAIVLCALVVGSAALFDEDVRYKPSICRRQEKTQCDVGTCQRDVEIECYHGTCSSHTGECVCSPCWTGDSCDILENSHMPRFPQQTHIIDVNIKDTFSDGVIATVRAEDPDADRCSYWDSCPCANIVYSIEEGNEDSLFMIDTKRGDIRLSGGQLRKDLTDATKFELTVAAKNPVHRSRVRERLDNPVGELSENAASAMVVRIAVSSGIKSEAEVAHSRRRRSTSGVPTEETFTLEKLPPFTNTTDVKIGEKVPLRLTIWLPVQTTTMTVELLTPYESSAIMVLCGPQFTHVGDNYASFDAGGVTPVYSAHAGDFRYDRIVMDLGSVTNTGTDTADDVPNKIYLDFTVILQENNATEYGESYGVSASVEYGSDYSNVFVAQTNLIPVSDTSDWSTSSPVLTISGPSEMTTLSSAIFTIDLLLKNYVTDFYVDVVAEPHDAGNPIMKVCTFQLTGKGDNYGCMPDELPQYSSGQDNSTNATILARLDFGKVVNTGLRDGNNGSAENSLSMEAVVYITDSSDVVDGENYSLGVTVKVDGDKIYSNQQAITILTTSAPNMTEDPVIQFYAVDGYAVTIGGTVGFVITIDIPENTTSVFIVDVSMPYTSSNGAILSICRAEVVSVGYNIPCMGSMTPEFKQEDGQNADYVQFNFGATTNLGRRHQTDDNKLKVLITAELLADHPDVSNGSEFQITAGVSYEMADKDILWVSQAPITAVNYQHHEYANSDKIPKFKLQKRGKDYFLYNNSAVSFNITVTFAPETTYTPVLLNITAQRGSADGKPMFSICRVAVVKIGPDFYCHKMGKTAVTYVSTVAGVAYEYLVDLGVVTNSLEAGMQRDPDDGSFVVEVSLHWEDHAELVHGENLTVRVQSSYGPTGTWQSSMNYIISFDRPEFTEDEIPVVRFTKLNAEPLVTIGGAVVFNLDFFVPYGSMFNYKVRFFGDRIDPYRTTVCEARLIHSGWNIPCVNGTFLTTVYNSTTDDNHIDTAFIDVGTVANMNPSGSDEDSELNKVRVQLVTLLENNDAVMENDQLWLSAELKLDEHDEYYLSASFNATQGNIYSETNAQPQFQTYGPWDDIAMAISSKETYYLKITTPIMSTPMTINITMPIAGGEAFLTISDIQLVRVGVNYACSQLCEIEPIYYSTYSTSQNDTAFIDLGILANHGTTHYYQYNPEYVTPEDDEIIISLEVHLADHPDLVDGAEILFDVYFDYSLDRQTACNETVGVSITGYERPELEFNITMHEYDPKVTRQGDLILTELSFHHTNCSSSHAYGVVIYFMTPYYLEIDEDIQIVGPLCVKRSDAGIKFHFAEMFFTDTFTMWFNFSMDPNRYMPIDMKFVNTTVPFEIIYYKRDGTDGNGNIILGEAFKTETFILDLSFLTERCFDVLGVESSYLIKDCQITASSYLNNNYSPQMARLNSKSGWAPAIRDIKPYQGNDYIEIRFGGMHRFTGVRMQTEFNNSNAVMSFQLSYSEDGVVWYNYDHTFLNDYNETRNDTSSMNLIPTPFNGAHFRIRPQSYVVNTSYPVMRFELYGCKWTADINLDAACATTDFPDYPYYERGFIIEPMTGSVYVCILEYIDGPTRCSYSLDNGTTWEEMDNTVANVIGLEPDTKELFGISQNRRAILRSGNLGITWSSMEPERYLELSNSGFLLETIRVPFTEIVDEPDIVMATEGESVFFEWGAATDGLYRREVVVTNGGTTTSDWELMGMWGYP